MIQKPKEGFDWLYYDRPDGVREFGTEVCRPDDSEPWKDCTSAQRKAYLDALAVSDILAHPEQHSEEEAMQYNCLDEWRAAWDEAHKEPEDEAAEPTEGNTDNPSES